MGAFDDILGQARAVELLERLIERDRVPHALLFHGPAGVGKATTALAFAHALLCTGAASRPCGECPSCEMLRADRRPALRSAPLVDQRSVHHPDLLWVTRRLARDFKKSAPPGVLSRDIRIEQIRETSHLAGQRPRLGARRLYIVEPAERMNPYAQNALLKTLEEPGATSVIVLVTARPQLLLPTVRSRSFAVPFVTLRPAILATLLEARGVEPAEALVRASLSDGCPGKALALDVEELQRRRQALLALLDRIVASPANADAITAQSKNVASADEAEFVENLDLLESLVRDGIRAAVQPDDPTLIHADVAPQLARLGARLGAERGARLLRSIEALRTEMIFTPNRQLMVEALLAAAAGGPLPRARI